jgi:hypothetical protein
MSSGSVGLSAVAWLVALSLALAAGGVFFGIASLRRAREAERRLRSLEMAIGEFCGALRARVVSERARLAPATADAQQAPNRSPVGAGTLSASESGLADASGGFEAGG